MMLGVLSRIYSLPHLIHIFKPRNRYKLSVKEVFHLTDSINDSLLFLSEKLRIRKNFCLRKSLILGYFLQKFDQNPLINIGIKIDNDRAEGHCWLSLDEKVIYDGNNINAQYDTLLIQKEQVVYWLGTN